jgi:hypothetical protein
MSVERNNSILCVPYVSYRNYQEEKPICVLKWILSRLACRKYILYINNHARDHFVKRISENEYEISGDNVLREFSGWQKGVVFTREQGISCDGFLFVNDMFLHNSFFHRRLIDQAALECALRNDALVGKRMGLPVAGDILGNSLIPYARTHIFFASKKVVDTLGSLVSVDKQFAERVFVPEFDSDIPLFRKNAPLSEEVKQFIFSYLTSFWYHKQPYIPENFEVLKNKAAAILNTFLLSMRVNQLGFPLISYHKARSFLSTPLSREEISAAWLDGAHETLEGKTPVNAFWKQKMPFYRYLPKKRPTWEHFENFLEGQSSLPDHL